MEQVFHLLQLHQMIFFILHFSQLSFLAIKEELTRAKRINGQDTAWGELMQSRFGDD